MLLGGALMGVFMGALSILTVTSQNAKWVILLPLLLLIVIVFFVMMLYIRVGQGGSRLKTTQAKTLVGAMPDDDKYWKLGQFYFNKKDSSLFVEKRFGVGYSPNYAHPLSWILIFGLIAIVVVAIIFSIKLT
jgi:uncharacterized membrane protein